MQSQQQYEIEQILAAKYCKYQKKYYYLIKWFNWYVEESTWQPQQNLNNATQIIQQFFQKQRKNQANFDWKKYEKLKQFWRKRKHKLDEQKKCTKHKKIKKEWCEKNKAKPFTRKRNNNQLEQQSSDVNVSLTSNKKLSSSNVIAQDQNEVHANRLMSKKQIIAQEEKEIRKAVAIQKFKNQINKKKKQLSDKAINNTQQYLENKKNGIANFKDASPQGDISSSKKKCHQIRKMQKNKINTVYKKVGKRNILEVMQKTQKKNTNQKTNIDQANRTRQTDKMEQNSKQINVESIYGKQYPKNYIIINEENQLLKQLQQQQLKQKNKSRKTRNGYISSGMNVKNQIKDQHQNKSNNSSYIQIRQQESWTTPLSDNQEYQQSQFRVAKRTQNEMHILPDLPLNQQHRGFDLDQNQEEEQQPLYRYTPEQDQQEISMNLSVSKIHVIQCSNNYQRIYSEDAEQMFNPTRQQSIPKAKEGSKLTQKQILKMQIQKYKEELNRNSNMGLNNTYYIYDTTSKSQSNHNNELQKKRNIIQPNIHNIIKLPQVMPQSTLNSKQSNHIARKQVMNSNSQINKGRNANKKNQKNIEVNPQTNIANQDKIQVIGLKRFTSNDNDNKNNKSQIKYYIHNRQTGIRSWLSLKQASQTCPMQIIKFYENKTIYSHPSGTFSKNLQHQ